MKSLAKRLSLRSHGLRPPKTHFFTHQEPL
jgi:hypothetical protein